MTTALCYTTHTHSRYTACSNALCYSKPLRLPLHVSQTTKLRTHRQRTAFTVRVYPFAFRALTQSSPAALLYTRSAPSASFDAQKLLQIAS